MSNIAIQGAATGTGVFTLASPATNTDRTLTLPDEAGTVLTSAGSLPAGNLTGSVPASAMPAGSVLQVVTGELIPSNASTSSTSFQTSGIQANITPSSNSNRVMVLLDCQTWNSTASDYCVGTIYRDGVNLFSNTKNSWFLHGLNGTGYNQQLSATHVDSPNTTSSVNYHFYFASFTGGTTIRVGDRLYGSPRLYLLEIAG